MSRGRHTAGLTVSSLSVPALRHTSSYARLQSSCVMTAFTPAMVSGAVTSTVLSPSGV